MAFKIVVGLGNVVDEILYTFIIRKKPIESSFK